jgi:type II secretory pathway component PulM
MKQARYLFLGLIGVNILLIIGTLALFTVASGAAQKKSQQVSDLKAQVESNSQALENFAVLQKTLAANKDLLSRVNKVLPSDKDQSVILAQLDQFANTSQLSVKQITFSTVASKVGDSLTAPSGIAGVSAITATVHIEDSHYDNLLSFLHHIETSQRRMQVTSIAISPNTTNPKNLDKIDLTVNVYLKSLTTK